MIASAGGFMITFVEALEAWVRLTTAVVLLIVALVSLRNLLKPKSKKR